MTNPLYTELTELVNELNELHKVDKVDYNYSRLYFVRLTKSGGYKAYRDDEPHVVFDADYLRERIADQKTHLVWRTEQRKQMEKVDEIIARMKTVVTEEEFKLVLSYLQGY